MKSRWLLLTLAALAVAAAIALRQPWRPAVTESVATPSPAQPAPGPRLEEKLRDGVHIPPGPDAPGKEQPAQAEQGLAPRLELERGKLAWEEQIEGVLSDGKLNETGKARQLLAMIPAMPEHGLTTLAEEASKLLPDRDYNAVGLPVLANPQTHGLVMSVLFADLMERPDTVTLPALLRIAQAQGHPYAPYARDNLALLLGHDCGSDWVEWERQMRQYLDTHR